MANTDLNIFFWTDSQGRHRVGYGKATHVTNYDVSYGLNDTNDNSVKDNINHRGDSLSTERRKLHNQIISDVFKGHTPYKDGQTKIAMFTGGAPASGKSTFTKDIPQYYQNDDNPIILDADALKERLLKADHGDKAKMTDELAKYYHSESVLLQKRMYEIALANDYPVVLDGTAARFPEFMKKVTQASQQGYKTKMCYMMTDANSLLDGSLNRYQREGRLVPLTRIIQAAQQAQNTVPQLFDSIDDFKLYYRKGNSVKAVAKGGKGKKRVTTDDVMWKNCFDPNAYHLDSGAVAMYNNKVVAIKQMRGD